MNSTFIEKFMSILSMQLAESQNLWKWKHSLI